ncbi:MAG: exodeoxyribonuclease VII large subunit [Clostridia bacterium]|nr:exodeoxyribonuclease VII large subunit [Clostridia bacterium]
MSKIISVSQFNTYVHNIFLAEELLYNIQLYGEVSGVSYSGNNVYFNIKDENALLSCVKFGLKDGDYMAKEGEMVIVQGSPNYYVKGGRFSFNVNRIEPYGQGALYKQFLELKNKLETMGLFDSARKKPIPEYIRRVGVVSSETGAVIQDIIDIAHRRNPMLDIVLYPAKVQGIGAENTIIAGIKALDKLDVDVIIIARGGGSAEDLSTFNNEALAMAIAEANKPIISAVGHETDFSISDFVADLRAPTPSAAAELVAVDLVKLSQIMQSNAVRLLRLTENVFTTGKERVDMLYGRAERSAVLAIQQESANVVGLSSRLSNAVLLEQKNFEHKFNLLAQKLENLNPVRIMRLGYAQVASKGVLLSNVDSVAIGDEINIALANGTLDCKVINKEKKE